jgi:NAD(P)-dependent dehydrogenase (short-subunit alcohol dehydrogenase family)
MRRAVLVTGAGRGIGVVTCRHLRGEAWHVAGLTRRSSVDLSASPCADFTRSGEMVEALHTVPRRRLLVHVAATIGPVVPLPVAAAICEPSRREPSSLCGRTFRVGAL